MSTHGVLGEQTTYPKTYDAGILYPIERKLGRSSLALSPDTLSNGADIWHGYELSWLGRNGVPQVAIVQLTIAASSPFIIESKSLKLYLNSFNFSRFDGIDEVATTIKTDLSLCLKTDVSVVILPVNKTALPVADVQGVCIDGAIEHYQESSDIDRNFLTIKDNKPAPQRYYSHLLRSNCPVTNQPDWGTVVIDMDGAVLNQAGLLRYLLGFRNHNGFHEQCVEQIFSDLMTTVKPQALLVQAFYTRRGGIDINPYRIYGDKSALPLRLVRQ